MTIWPAKLRRYRPTCGGRSSPGRLFEIEHITAPTLSVCGDADGVVDRGMQSMLAGRTHGAESLAYHGVGHTPRWEHTTRFAGDVDTLVERSMRATLSVSGNDVRGP